MNMRLVMVGTIVFWLVSNIVGIAVTGPIIHEKILDPEYRANESFWLPELSQDPPDYGALMPRWLLNSFLTSLVVAGIYSCVRNSFPAPGWKQGFYWGLSLAVLMVATNNAWSGVFDLPSKLWIWWSVDVMIVYSIAGIAMGWAGSKFGGD